MPTETASVERAILAAAINSGGNTPELLYMDSSDFTDPRNRTIASVLRDMIRRNQPIERITVKGELEALGKLNTPGGAGGDDYLWKLVGIDGIIPQNVFYYAEELRNAARVRAVQAAANRLSVQCDHEEAATELGAILAEHRRAIDAIPAVFDDTASDDSFDTLETMLSETDTETDWLIPGWLSREERVVLVAGEGVAKTTLLRQFAVCLAGGLHPWTGKRVADGLRVLFVDAENSRDQSRRAYRWIAGRCYRPTMAHGWKSRIIHKTRNDGVNLIGADEGWFRDLADRTQPDVIILSPAYKLMRGDPKEDRDVLALLDVIDRVRVQHRAAVLIETHAPHGQFMTRDMRPFGSSVWLRWPEIGLGLQRDTDVPREHQSRKPDQLETVDWRGAREPRDWPDQIRYGSDDELPWVPRSTDWAPSIDIDYRPGEEAA